MVQTSAGGGPIPSTKNDDSEDVAWALSTAEAMFARGDRGDALKWLRRAAESASENEANDRAVELAKAAAELAALLGTSSNVVSSAPSSRPFLAARPQGIPSALSPPKSPISPPRPSASAGALGRAGVPPIPPRIDPLRAWKRAPPAPGTATPQAQRIEPAPAPAAAEARAEASGGALAAVASGAMWATRTLLDDDDLDDADAEKTRIGVPAYDAHAMAATETPATARSPALRPAQAVRVVVWRAADGVHVAPQGTRVSAISVDAILVALDPSADLAAWLSTK
jgi:hypothetical protein